MRILAPSLVALGLAVVSTVIVVAPVASHRILFRRSAKPELVSAAHRLTKAGLTTLALTIVAVVVLVFGFVAGPTAALVAGVADDELPLVNRPAEPLDIGPLDPLSEAALAVWGTMTGYPVALAGVIVAATAAAVLPSARDRSRYGVAAVGAVLTVLSVVAGAALVSTIVVVLVWYIAAAVAGALRAPGGT